MANLSNINGKFVVEQTTGYVGVGTTDPNYPIEVSNASAEIALNATGGSIYRVQSDSASNFIIRKAGVGDRLVINSTGNATFAGNVDAGGRLRSGVGSDSGSQLNLWADSNGSTFLAGYNFAIYTGSNNARTQSFIIDQSKNATFAGNVSAQGGTFTQAGGGVQILNNGTAGYNANLFFGKSGGTDGYSIGQGVTANDGVFRIYNNGTASVPLAIADNNNSTFAGEIRTANRLAIKETYFGYSSGYKVIQVGESAATSSISLGYNPSSNTNGGFSGNEILIPNNIRILAPNAADNLFYGVMLFNSSNKLLIGSSNYLIENNYIMALDPATKNVGIGTDSPGYKLDVSGGNMAIRNSAGSQLLFFEPGRAYTDGMRLLRYQDKLSLTYGWNANEEALTIVGGTGSDVGNVGIGTTSPGDAKLYVNGGTTLGGSTSDAGATRIFGDIKRPQANYFVRRNYNLAAGASGALYSIARQWHDHANWGLGNINVIMWGIYYGQGQFNKADFSCRYGYNNGGADVQTNFNTNSMTQPAWTAATLVSGNIHYRDLQIQIPAYHQISFEIISPGLQQTYNVNNTAGNTVYLYPH